MGKKNLPVLLLTLGVLLFLVALSADSLGLGGEPGLGTGQIGLTFTGIGAAALGMVLLRSRN